MKITCNEPLNLNPIDIRALHTDRLLFGPELDDEKLKLADKLLSSCRDTVIQICFAILDEEELYWESASGEGCAPINAIKLLHHWRVRKAVPRLWRIIEEEPNNPLLQGDVCVAAMQALIRWGDEIVNTLFQIAKRVDAKFQPFLAACLAHNGKRQTHPRVYDWMKARFLEQHEESSIDWWGMYLIRMGGEDAIALVEERILRIEDYGDGLKDKLRKSIHDYRAGYWQ